MSRIDFGKKSTNLEQRIQRIQVQRDQKLKNLLMSQVFIEEKPNNKPPKKEENHNQQKFPNKQQPMRIQMTDGLLPPGGVYICDECHSDERSPYQLCEHKAIYHCPQDQRVWKCVYCNTTFGRRGGLRRHVQMVHMQMMHKCPFKDCTHPGYKCTKALSAHIKTHTLPFACDRCNMSFARKPELQTHLYSHSQF